MTANSPYVSRLTRQWLLHEHGHRLGKAMAEDLVAVVYHHRIHNLCGLVYDAAHVLKLPEEQCIALGSWADLFYCCIGAIDDIQDGDADDYMPWPRWRQVNAAMALLSHSELRLLEVWRNEIRVFWAISCDTTRTTSQMVRAQYTELQAKANGYGLPWDIDAYERNARMTAGAELALFLGAVGAVAGYGLRHTLRQIGYTVGVLLQIRIDLKTYDERVTVLPGEDVDDLRRQHTELFFQHAEALPDKLVAMLLGVAGIGDDNA